MAVLPITLHGRIDDQHRLIVELPDDLPKGEVEVVIRPLSGELTLEEIDARLRAAGVLADPDDIEIPEDAVPLTVEERERIGRLFVTDRPVEVDIDEDRGLY